MYEALSELLISSKYLATLKLKFANVASAGMISLFDTIGNSKNPGLPSSSAHNMQSEIPRYMFPDHV